jgi:hypothetical protein
MCKFDYSKCEMCWKHQAAIVKVIKIFVKKTSTRKIQDCLMKAVKLSLFLKGLSGKIRSA